MKKIAAIIILSCMSLYALAQYFELDYKLQCNTTDVIVKAITERYKEEPIWIGDMTDDTKAMLFVNVNTSDWTFIVVSHAQSKACVVNTGSGFSYRQPVRLNKHISFVDNKSII